MPRIANPRFTIPQHGCSLTNGHGVGEPSPPWQIAFDRFTEVPIGIGVALILALVWPEKEATPIGESLNSSPAVSDSDQGGSKLIRPLSVGPPATTDEKS